MKIHNKLFIWCLLADSDGQKMIYFIELDWKKDICTGEFWGGPPPFVIKFLKIYARPIEEECQISFVVIHRSYNMSSLTRIAHKSVLKYIQNPGASGSLKAAPRPRPLRTPLKQILDPPCTDIIHPFYISHTVCYVGSGKILYFWPSYGPGEQLYSSSDCGSLHMQMLRLLKHHL